MPDNFAACLAVTLAYEGGRADDPRDPGGRTNRGITQRTYDVHRRSDGLPGRDVFDITDAEVRDIYRRDYWQPSGAGALPAGLDLSLFDAAVNSGVGQGRRWLARAQQQIGAGQRRDVADGIRAFAAARLAFLHALRGWASFGRGWAVRVAGVEARALRMALDAAGLPPPVAAAAIAAGGATHARAAVAKHAAAHLGTALAGTSLAGAALARTGIVGAHLAPLGALAGALALAAAALLAFGGWRDGLRAAAQTAEIQTAEIRTAGTRAVEAGRS